MHEERCCDLLKDVDAQLRTSLTKRNADISQGLRDGWLSVEHGRAVCHVVQNAVIVSACVADAFDTLQQVELIA